MKTTNKPNAILLWKQFEDQLIPGLGLSLTERAVYSHLLRHSHLEGKRRIVFSMNKLAAGTGLCNSATRPTVRRLIDHGALRLVKKCRAGHVVEVRLPEEIRGTRREPPRGHKPAWKLRNLEEADFFNSKVLRQSIHAREQGRCFYCLRRIPSGAKGIDHVVPQAEARCNSFRNLVSACVECNSLKGDRSAADFLRELYCQGRLTGKQLTGRLHALEDLAAGNPAPCSRPRRQAPSYPHVAPGRRAASPFRVQFIMTLAKGDLPSLGLGPPLARKLHLLAQARVGESTMPIHQSRRLLRAALGIAVCVPVTPLQAQEPSPKQEAINLLRQASQLVNQIPEPQRMSAAANIAGRLTAAGDFSTALAMAHSLTRPQDRGSALNSIAYSLDYQGRLEETLQVLSEVGSSQANSSYSMLAKSHADKKDFAVAMQLARRIQDQPMPRVEALLAIAKSQWEAGKRDGIVSTMLEALEVAEQARQKEPQMSILMLGIARTQKEIGMSSESHAMLMDYSEFVRQRKDEGGLSCLAVTLADMGDIRGALEIIEELPEGSNRDSALGIAATNLAKMGSLPEALETISRASSQHTRDMFLRSMAAQQGQDGHALSALESVGLIPSIADQADALATLALAQVEKDDPAARETIELAWKAANSPDANVPAHVLGTIAVARVELGDLAEAKKILQRLSPEGRTWPLWNITTNLAESGDKASALTLANEETEPQPKAYALLGTATGMLHRMKAEVEKEAKKR